MDFCATMENISALRSLLKTTAKTHKTYCFDFNAKLISKGVWIILFFEVLIFNYFSSLLPGISNL